jgi:hypoxanthine phosphoribosyltransferase
MRVLLTQEQLRQGIERMAEEIRKHYDGRPLTIVGVLTGSVLLLADLIRLLDMPLRVGLVQAQSCAVDPDRPGPLALDVSLLACDVQGRHVLLVDDVFDTGRTLWDVVPEFDDLGAKSVHTAVLLKKKDRAEVSLRPDFAAFEIPNEFVVGYGMDHRDRYRNLPCVAALEPNEMAEE